MDRARRSVRSQRTRSRERTIAVTGASRPVGAAAVRLLAAHPSVRRVVALSDAADAGFDPALADAAPHLAGADPALDPAAPDPADADPVTAARGRRDPGAEVVRVDADLTDPGVVARLAGCDAVVHAALDDRVDGDAAAADARSRRNVRAAQTVVTAAAAASARQVVLLTSAMAYGAHPDNPVPLDEDGPLRAAPDGPLVRDLLELEALAARAPRAHGGLRTTVVRPAALVGPGVDTALTRHFESPRLLVLRGSEPRWQFCHVDDAAAALVAAALGAVGGDGGPVTVGADGWLGQDAVEALSGRGRLELPAAVAYGTAERLHRLGLTPAPASELAYLAHPWVVPSTRLRATGWRPAYDNTTALQVLLAEAAGRHAVAARRIGGRETATLAAAGAAGAAGATVAALTTAAIVRRARRRRR